MSHRRSNSNFCLFYKLSQLLLFKLFVKMVVDRVHMGNEASQLTFTILKSLHVWWGISVIHFANALMHFADD